MLLEITPIERSNDIHYIVGRVRERAQAILETHLHYDERAINGFIVALSEVCQNIIEHSENKGFVGIQKYRFPKLNRNIVKIAVMDIGIGFRKSLSTRFKLKSDLEAIDKALLHGASRHEDEGRGHGLAAVRRFVTQWDGRISIRSGSARLSIIPAWARGKEQERGLTRVPGFADQYSSAGSPLSQLPRNGLILKMWTLQVQPIFSGGSGEIAGF